MLTDRQAVEGTGERTRSWALRNGVHLMVLWAFAVVRPTLDLLSQGPDLFVARKADGYEFVAVVLAFALLPPLIMLGLEVLAGRFSRRLRDWLHLALAWGLLALFALYILRQLFPSLGAIVFIGAILLASAATAGYARLAAARTFLDYLSPAPIIFLVAFFASSPAKSLIFETNPPPAAEAGTSTVPVIWVMFDELPISSLMGRHERIDAARFPNFARLARNATWFKNVAASADQTDFAAPAILTGEKPRAELVPTVGDHPDNLFTLLNGSHSITAMEHATWLCPDEICPPQFSRSRRMYDLASAMSLAYLHAITPPRYEDRLPALGRTWGEALSPELSKQPVDPNPLSSSELARHGDAQFDRFLSLIQPYFIGGRPPLYFLHSSLPHSPWNFLPSGKVYADVKAAPIGLDAPGPGPSWTSDRQLVDHNFQRHLLQTMFVDRLLGKLIRHLRQSGLYDRSLLVISADHGVSFQPGSPYRSVQRYNAGDEGLVPFFVKAPDQRRGRVIDRHIQTIDELPTVAQELGVRNLRQFDGRSAFSLRGSGRREAVDLQHIGEIEIRVPFSLLIRQRRETLRHQTRVFGTGRTPTIYAIGRHRSMVGMEASDFNPTRSAGLAASLDHGDEYREVDPSSRYVPSLVSGEISGPASASVADVAIAVNGRIEAVAPTHSRGGIGFWAMIPDSSLKAGHNDIALYAIAGGRRDPRLLELEAGSD